jgi:hypothetical protein
MDKQSRKQLLEQYKEIKTYMAFVEQSGFCHGRFLLPEFLSDGNVM